MSSREKILQAIQQAKPALQPLPATIGFASTYPDVAAKFTDVLQSIGGHVVTVDSLAAIQAYVSEHYERSQPIISLVPGLAVGRLSPHATDIPQQYENLHLALLPGKMGVAENGAVWVDEQSFPLRALPFITLNLALVLREEDLVGNLHEAYARMDFTSGYGAFIAGPSKTADIEQSLVIGAHGPKSMTLFLLRKESLANFNA